MKLNKKRIKTLSTLNFNLMQIVLFETHYRVVQTLYLVINARKKMHSFRFPLNQNTEKKEIQEIKE